MRPFLRKAATTRDPLPIAMCGARMGERVLQIGADDFTLAAAIAAKTGLSGHAAMAVPNDAAAARARERAAEAGVLLDVHVSRDSLPFPDASFDLAVIHAASGFLAALDATTRARLLEECRRVLRHGGRIVTVEAGPRGILATLFRRRNDGAYQAAGGTLAALEAARFKPVRLLAEREGFRFVEGINGIGS